VNPQTQHQARILLAEDSSAIRRVIQAGLGRAGYVVVAKESGAAAVRELELGGHFDALLTDVVMPGGDGVSIARAFRLRFPTSLVLFMSGYEDEGAALDVVLHGSHLLPKPFRLTELIEVLDSYVRA
jgi:CheY-like chemotaxis protein